MKDYQHIKQNNYHQQKQFNRGKAELHITCNTTQTSQTKEQILQKKIQEKIQRKFFQAIKIITIYFISKPKKNSVVRFESALSKVSDKKIRFAFKLMKV